MWRSQKREKRKERNFNLLPLKIRKKWKPLTSGRKRWAAWCLMMMMMTMFLALRFFKVFGRKTSEKSMSVAVLSLKTHTAKKPKNRFVCPGRKWKEKGNPYPLFDILATPSSIVSLGVKRFSVDLTLSNERIFPTFVCLAYKVSYSNHFAGLLSLGKFTHLQKRETR